MESVEEFMRRHIAEHIVEEKRQQASLAPFRRRFYTADCIWSSRPGTLELLQSETGRGKSHDMNSSPKSYAATRI